MATRHEVDGGRIPRAFALDIEEEQKERGRPVIPTPASRVPRFKRCERSLRISNVILEGSLPSDYCGPTAAASTKLSYVILGRPCPLNRVTTPAVPPLTIYCETILLCRGIRPSQREKLLNSSVQETRGNAPGTARGENSQAV
jgi:hypothetical protein